MTARRAVLLVAVVAAVVAGMTPEAEAQCWVWSVQGVNFGTYDVFDPAPLDSAGAITILCLPSRWIQVTLSRGDGPTYNPRQMRSGTNQLAYNLFLDAGRTVIWGDGTGGTQLYQDNGIWFSLSIYGRVPAGQDVAIGSYTDRIIARIDF